MPSESVDRKAAAHAQQMGPAENHHHEPLPCPRCDSINTKFCYYNNYNFSQPRHFCKSCRRYWTQGGTLRDIPIGGGFRKSAKRPRTSADPIPSTPLFVSLSSSAGPNSFTSLLNSAGPGVLPLGGFGLGLGLEDVGFGLGRGVWALPPGIGYANGSCANAQAGGDGGGGEGNSVIREDRWQVECGESDLGGDCFASLPELAISTPGNGLK